MWATSKDYFYRYIILMDLLGLHDTIFSMLECIGRILLEISVLSSTNDTVSLVLTL